MKKVGEALRLSASDLVGFLNCHYLTSLELLVAAGVEQRPFNSDPMLEVLRERGFRHEDAYLRHLESQGRRLTRIDDGDISPSTVEQTRAAMAAGDDVIVQAALQDGCWAGKADVLLRVEVPSALGAWSYEVVDTKLARETKAGTILQLCLYSELVGLVQGRPPEQMYVIAPWREFVPEPWRVADFAAYFRKVKAELEQAITSPEPSGTLYPEPVAHCDVCNWRQRCEEKRRADDHLSLVAGVSRLQARELESRGISTMADLAVMPLPLEPRPDRGSPESYAKIREQARVQVEARTEGKLKYELLPFEAGFGLGRLPEPTDADVFLDFEGDPFVGEQGLEYLLGYHFRASNGEWTYRGAWALDREAEKAAFEEFIDFVVARREQQPGLHVYHYGGYESGALKRLMGRYATRQDEVDDLLRGGVLVDLLGVVRQGVRASVESYSIKRLEPFYEFERVAILGDANLALRRVETGLELDDPDIAAADREVVQAYNRDDCVSTRALRDWLEELRRELVEQGADVQRPGPAEDSASEEVGERAALVAALVERLTHDVPVDAMQRDDEQQARWILAHLLEWHRREAKAVWWEFFRLRDLPAEDLLEERSGLFGLEFVETVDGGTAQCPVHRYRFPLQEADIRVSKKLKNVGGENFGQVVAISLEDGTIDIKKMKKTANVHPQGVFVHEFVGCGIMEDALLRLADHVAEHGIEGDGPNKAARDLLLRRAPFVEGGNVLPLEGEDSLQTALRVVGRLRTTTLPIQGPPGSGKTFTGANMICELVKRGQKVGVVANSHAVIKNLLECTVREAKKSGLDFECIHKTDADGYTSDRIRTTGAPGPAEVLRALATDCPVAGGTAWLWAHEDAYRAVDVLFVDEAAQMSLANVLAAAQAAGSVVLLGDPQQLDQPTQGSHPDGTECSALDHVLNGKQTIDQDEGLFLAETWRLHPRICDFTSELFYEDKLHSRPGLEQQRVSSAGLPPAGLMYVPVTHVGNQNSSPEEARVVSALIERILQTGSEWTDNDGSTKPVTLEDILVITPYNAQVQQIQRLVPGVEVGTVDKFQGQEAAIAIYSLATSSHADAPRGMEFLYSLNRLNVATSRAKCVSIVVASPAVFEPECATPRQLKLANAFCRFLELSRQGDEVVAPISVD